MIDPRRTITADSQEDIAEEYYTLSPTLVYSNNPHTTTYLLRPSRNIDQLHMEKSCKLAPNEEDN